MIRSETARNVLNFACFQVGWLICVLYPGLLAAGLVLLFLVAHFVLVSQKRFSELQFIGLGTVVGAALDLLWFRTGILASTQGEVVLTPPWLVAIWAIFMTTLSHSLNWISRRVWLAFVLAPMAGPFAYWSASKLGAVTLPELIPSLLALALGWLVVFPLLLFLRKSLYPELQP
ncbi:DUF2878 domain-containing protein [Marinobacter qingdaonensis]|uniref:DUF2878 domain-containing protein n=1 Tax=Marinobacter qingdaonensis TaxID=3108486 RepID=A0ABU5P1P6_9GAMM|nr:DUF2878 domain-containing protein [Marinobacter sp. ASW11-75]MEA1081990.1 DUF2878 domain-containing protein [Marinobacter sp. ASW11-75]